MENSISGMAHLSILVIDEESDISKTLCGFLEAEGHSVTVAGKPEDALSEAGRRYFDLAFIDLGAATQSGIELITIFRAKNPWMKLVVCAATVHASNDSVIEALKCGAFDYLIKPLTHDRVAHLVRKAAEVRTLEQKLSMLQELYNETVPEVAPQSSSTAMRRVLALAGRVADSEATILIRGESGAGKSMLARVIHSWSSRASKPFAAISCACLPEELLESELFGYAQGASKGALLYPGHISTCQGGALLLDAIEDMPLSVQARLLRFLEEKIYERVGDHAVLKADVRIIVTTNANLEEAVKTGKLREDLFYRLNAVEMTVPPLRERREDIIPIAESFLAFFAKQNRTQATVLSGEAAEALTRYDWPKNVRELRNTVERAVLLCKGQEIGVRDLFARSGLAETSPIPGDPVPLEKIEELHIRRVLASTKSIEEASRILKVDLVTLWRRRKKYRI